MIDTMIQMGACLAVTSTVSHSLLRHAHNPINHLFERSEVRRMASLDPRDVDLVPALALDQLDHVSLALVRYGKVLLAEQVGDCDVLVPGVRQGVCEAGRRVVCQLLGQALALLDRYLGCN